VTDFRAEGRKVLREMLPESSEAVEQSIGDGSFGDELLEIGVENIFGRLWSRQGLSRRDRSLVTMGILIALRATDEFKAHVQIGLNNGLTEDEIAEVIYHSSGYAGFPNANTALTVAREVLPGGGATQQ
jgi:4-carboxymuconolactone decarboxylase